MCNVMVANTIVEVLDGMVQRQEVFTAYDVTSAARVKTDDNVYHKDVRTIVNNEFRTQQMTGYDRELCTLNVSNNPQVFVYFPNEKSASDHPLVSDGIVTDDEDDDMGDILNDDEYNVTAEGRITIPKTILSQIASNAGSYNVLISGSLKCATPNKDGRVRISLRQSGISGNKIKLTVNSLNDTINIESV